MDRGRLSLRRAHNHKQRPVPLDDRIDRVGRCLSDVLKAFGCGNAVRSTDKNQSATAEEHQREQGF
jgi:hypothetical protein